MNIDHIEAFIYISHYGSFNKAAEALFLSQPSVSARIQTLERELNCTLFSRESRRVELSEQGKIFLPYAKQLLQVYERGVQKLQLQAPGRQELRIGCTISVSNYILPWLLPAVREQHEHFQARLTTELTDQIVLKVLNKELDVGFVRHITHPNLHSVAFYEDPIKLFVPDHHPFVRERYISLERLSGQELVFFECGSLDWVRIHRLFESLDSPPRIVYHVDHLETAKKLVLQGCGICLLPSLCVQEEVKQGALHAIAVPELEDISLRTNLIYLKEQPSPFISTLLELRKRIWVNAFHTVSSLSHPLNEDV
ncbi:LysR family transcriptional regulator [Paenibacillus taiwanensis]|uniref:LysR family transcriptional regulator n=1 Tax=Paenibacillus taiwanensis TaxID=401638 RepID=UPI0006840C47|nr:LysR family transcriptional regulator [Paenibacillus taiwanensis]